jgi:hypothetical protein
MHDIVIRGGTIIDGEMPGPWKHLVLPRVRSAR